MRIRTRHKLFRIIIIVAIVVFLATLFDMFLNDSSWRMYLLIAYVALGVAALILYLGHKPDLDEPEEAVYATPVQEMEPVPAIVEPEPAPMPVLVAAPPEPEIPIEEVPMRRSVVPAVDVQGPHHFKCPFCAHLFAFEATHIQRESDFRMDCPFCGRNIKIPRDPRIARGDLESFRGASSSERSLWSCTTCGEVMRFTTPDVPDDRRFSIRSCPHCRSPQVLPAAV